MKLDKSNAGKWRMLPMAVVFEADFAAWLKSLSRKARHGEAIMHWTDLGPFSTNAYALHEHLAGMYEYAIHRGQGPTALPNDCTPEGFYLAAVASRQQQVGVHEPVSPTPYERLSAFSQFLYCRMSDRIATAAGFGPAKARKAPADDGLGDGLDDGLGEGPGGALGALDGLDPGDGLDDLDDGLGDGLELALVDDGLDL